MVAFFDHQVPVTGVHVHIVGLITRWASRHRWRVNGVRLVLLALSTTACANAKVNDNANNASLTPPKVAHVVTNPHIVDILD